MTHVTRKQTLRSLSLLYQKKDGRCHAHPSFFWYDNDKDLKVIYRKQWNKLSIRHGNIIKLGIKKWVTNAKDAPTIV